MKRLLSLLLATILLLGAVPVSANSAAADATILFTHDLHSHFLPSRDLDGGEFGGYARLMTAINQEKQRNPDALLLDGGDFSMGSLFQTAFATSATELRIMGAMGYDVTTFGNHEFDYLPKGLASMLTAAKNSGDRVPAIVDANYLPPQEGEEGYGDDAKMMWDALNLYGVADYTILERGGVYFAIFGLMGDDSNNCAPNSGMVYEDPIATAQATVKTMIESCKTNYGVEPVVICLSHSGTENGEGEDVDLAKNVPDIDVIISGHTHTTLEAPITVGSTHVVSAAEYGRNLGVLDLNIDETGNTTVANYTLIPIDETVADDPAIAAFVADCKKTVESDYLNNYHYTFDHVVTNNPYTFDTVDEVYATQHESTLGNLFADAYREASEAATGIPADVALTASGVIRETLPVGDVTVSDVFNAASLGVGTEGELVAVYLTGVDLKNALEVDASVQPLMSAAQLFFSGVEYSFNQNRMIFNKIDSAKLRNEKGELIDIEDDRLYRVVAGMYVGQMLGSVKAKSFGLLSITPRDKDGNPIEADELVNHVVTDAYGNPIKEWYAIASYIELMGKKMSSAYEKPDGRKVVYASFAIGDLMKNANKFTYIVIGVVVVLLAAIVWAVVVIIRKIVKKRKNA